MEEPASTQNAATTTTTAPTSAPTTQTGVLWQMIYVGFVLLIMFGALISDKIGADMVMLAALTACMAAGIVSIEEGVAGFANTAVLTVMVSYFFDIHCDYFGGGGVCGEEVRILEAL